MKVLVITYYWPPSGGSGVQRWLKFVKYLRDFGWEPIVYTPQNGEIPIEDRSLLKDIPENMTVLKTPIWEPYSLYKKFIGQKKEQKINPGFLSESKKPKISEKVSIWIRGNFFIPDARKYWIKPSVKFLSNYLSINHVDLIISTGPPHSTHLIGMALKKKLNIPWIADFRDSWTNSVYYPELLLTNRADHIHKFLEKKVLQTANYVITIGETMKKEFEQLGAKKIEVITNGFDTKDFQHNGIKLDKKFSITHIGTMTRTRNPMALWNAISGIISTNKSFETDLEIKLAGKVDISVLDNINLFGLNKKVTMIDYLPHDEVTQILKTSQLLLLILDSTKDSKGILTGKFFEYLGAKRPILAIGPTDGDIATIMAETNAGKISEFNDENGLKKNILEYYKLYLQNQLISNSKEIEKYSRDQLTCKLAKLFENVVK